MMMLPTLTDNWSDGPYIKESELDGVYNQNNRLWFNSTDWITMFKKWYMEFIKFFNIN